MDVCTKCHLRKLSKHGCHFCEYTNSECKRTVKEYNERLTEEFIKECGGCRLCFLIVNGATVTELRKLGIDVSLEKVSLIQRAYKHFKNKNHQKDLM